jgi:hypothetical protein
MSFKIGNNTSSVSIGEKKVSKVFRGTIAIYNDSQPIEPLYISNIGLSSVYSESSFAKINNLKLEIINAESLNNTLLVAWAKLNIVLEDPI